MNIRGPIGLLQSPLAVLGAGILLLLAAAGCSPHQRVHRQHQNAVSKEFEPLTRRIEFSVPADTFANNQLSREEVEADLDELEWLLKHRYAYLTRSVVDYRAALDSIRCSVGTGIRRGTLAWQLQKLLALFGDGHTRVARPSATQLCSKFLPFLPTEAQGRLVAINAASNELLDAEHPFLLRIDEVEVEKWLQAASQTVAIGSTQYVRRASIGRLRDVESLRKELGLAPSERVRVELGSASGESRKTLNLPLADKRPTQGRRPPGNTNSLPIARVLPQNIGYLQLYPIMSDEPQFQEALVAAMGTFRNTQGLIVDVRGNGGGSRWPLRTLFPFFLAAEDFPKVLNVAAYRLGHRSDILEDRWLYPADWKGWSRTEKEAIQRFARNFRPQWPPPRNQFSDWHYFVIGPSREPGRYHYQRPVVILMDSRNFSAADIFLGAFKGQRNVTLMGTPSGGGSGRYESFRLLHSNIEVRLSSMVSFQPSGALYEGQGIQPDVLIEPTITDCLGKTDSTLETAVQRIVSESANRKGGGPAQSYLLVGGRSW